MAKFDRTQAFANQEQGKPRFDRAQPFATASQPAKQESRPTGSNGILRDARDAVLGQLQGLADVAVTFPAQVVDTVWNGGARLVDKGFGKLGWDTSGQPSLDELANRYIGTAKSFDEARQTQDEGFRRVTNDSQAGRIGRITGNIEATLPLSTVNVMKGASKLPRFVNGAVQGGLSGGVMSASNPDIHAGAQAGTGTVVGGAINWALPPVVKAASKALTPILPPILEMGKKATATVTPEITTQAQLAAEKAGIPWSSIDDGLRTRISEEVAKARQISNEVPLEAVARKAFYEAQGLTPTRGMATRNWEDAWREQNLLTEPEGEPLRQIYRQNNAAIRQNLQDLTPEGVQPVEAPAFGARLRGDIRSAERAAAGKVNEAYKAAEAAEGDRLFDTQPLVNYMQDNIAMLNATNAGKPVIAYMQKLGVISPDNMQPIMGANGLPGQGYKALPLKMKEAVALRKVVNDAWSSATKAGDDTAAYQLNQMRQMLNTAEQQAGGDLYKAARQLRQQKGNAFENNPLIDKLLSKQKGYNADLIEDSQVFDKAILGSTPEQFGAAWAQASKEIRAQTQAQLAKHLETVAFGNQARNEAGEVVASAAKLDKAVKDIGIAKLRMVFGQERANRIQMLAKSLGEISNPPRGTVPQGSAPKLAFLSRALMGTLNLGGKVPGWAGGDLFAGAAGMIKRGADSRQNSIDVKNAADLLGPYIEDAANTMALARIRGAVPGTSVLGTDSARERVRKR